MDERRHLHSYVSPDCVRPREHRQVGRLREGGAQDHQSSRLPSGTLFGATRAIAGRARSTCELE